MTINKVYEDILQLKTLTPCPEVDKAFTQLVNEAIKYESNGKLRTNEIGKLQQISAEAEYNLELHWANNIIRSSNPEEELKRFPYLQNYLDLTKLEINSLNACTTHNSHKFLFVGGGPLPMTALVLAKKYKISSTVLDMNEEAVEKAKNVIKSLHLSNLIEVKYISGENFNYKNYNVVFIAALAGLDSQTKNRIFQQIKSTASRGTHIMARSSWRNRKLLYKPLDTSIYKVFKPIIKVDPFNDIVNSIIILKYV